MITFVRCIVATIFAFATAGCLLMLIKVGVHAQTIPEFVMFVVFFFVTIIFGTNAWVLFFLSKAQISPF